MGLTFRLNGLLPAICAPDLRPTAPTLAFSRRPACAADLEPLDRPDHDQWWACRRCDGSEQGGSTQCRCRVVNVLLGPPGTVNVTLEIANASSEITVTDEVPLIQAENGDVSTTMTLLQVSQLPNPGNDLTYIVQTAPGVVMNTDSQSTGGIQNGVPNFSMLGMPGSSYHYTMDGMSIMDNAQNFIIGGSLGLSLGQNQIQEATVISTGYSGQFGGAAGGSAGSSGPQATTYTITVTGTSGSTQHSTTTTLTVQ
jgi:hypothetical protein